jgi:hypothetical protein
MSLWLNVIWAAIQLALFVIQKIQESELISQGKAQQLQEILEQSNVLIQQIQLDRKSPLSGVATGDEFNRDNDPKPIVASPDSMPVVLPSEVQQQSGQPADSSADPAQQPDVGKPGV